MDGLAGGVTEGNELVKVWGKVNIRMLLTSRATRTQVPANSNVASEGTCARALAFYAQYLAFYSNPSRPAQWQQ